MPLRYPFPENPQDLESLCLRLYRKHWNVPNLQKYGRRGHRQSGGDLMGTDNQGRICFIQCKHRDFDRKLSAQEVRDEVEAAKGFEPKVERFAIATTAKRDPDLQKLVAGITQEHAGIGLFPVEIDSWDDLIDILNEHSEIAEAIYRDFGASERIESVGSRKQTSPLPISALPITSPTGTLSADEPADIHAEIDEAGSYLGKGNLAVAEVLLDRIQKRQAGRFTARCWYRVLANQGHIHRLRGDFSEAGRLYLQAKDHQPQDQTARWMGGLGHLFCGDKATAADLAEQLMSDHPNFPRGWALFVMTRSDVTPLDEIESSIPLPIRSDAEVAINLAVRAAAQERWADSVRNARVAHLASPDWRDAKVQLAIGLISQRQAEAARSRNGRAAPEARPDIEEALNLFQQAIAEAPDYMPKTELAFLRLNSAAGHELLGQTEEADNLVVAAYEIAPVIVEVQRAYAVHLVRQGDLDKAAGVLSKALEGGYAPTIVLLLSQVLAQRNRDNDSENAIGLLEPDETKLERLAKEPPALRSDWASTLLRLRIARNKAAGVDSLLDGQLSSWLTPGERAIFQAGWAIENGDDNAAREYADQASREITEETHPLAIRQLGLVLHRLGSFEDAAQVLRTIVPLDHVDNESDLLFDCAHRANRLDLILEYSSQLRANGCFDTKYIRNEIALLSQVSPAKTIDVLSELLQSSIDEKMKRECRAVLSCLARILDKPDLIETNPSELPSVADLPYAKVGRTVVEVLRRGPKPLDGIVYAYELYRRFSGDVDAHMAVVSSFKMDLGRDFDLAEPTAVAPGTAVTYQEDDTGEEHCLVIEDSPGPDVSRDEHAPTEPVCTALMGKTKGEKFALREHPPRTGMITDVTSKYVFRLRHCLSNMETRFSGKSPVLEFHAPKQADGTPDVGPLLEQIREIGGQEDQALKVYRERPVPIHMVASVRRATVFEVAQHIAYDPKTKIRCCLGNPTEGEASFRAMRASNAFVLDVTALSTLSLFEAQGICGVSTFLKSLPHKAIVSEHVLLDLRQLQDRRFGTDREQLFIGASEGQLYRHTLSADEVKEARERLQSLLDLLREVCLVEQGTDLARHMHDEEDLLSIMGRAGLHSMLLAAEPGRVLWTDDRVSAQIAGERFAVNRTWTQAVLLWLEQTGRITKDMEQEATLTLIRAGYMFTGINYEHVMRAVDQAKWDVDSPLLAPILAQFAEGSVDPSTKLALAATTMKAIWQRGVIASYNADLTIRILGKLAADGTGRKIIDAIDSNVDQMFGVDVINAAGLKQAITAWKASEGGIIRP